MRQKEIKDKYSIRIKFNSMWSGRRGTLEIFVNILTKITRISVKKCT